MMRVFLLLLFLADCAEGRAGFGGTAGSASAGYSYDDVGNRLTRSTSGFTPGTLDNQSFAFDPNDRLNTDTYDANGNTLFGAGFNQTQADRYDFENRLIERRSTVASVTRTVNIACDGDGQRVSKTVNGITTFYLVDDLNPTGYAQVLEELAVDGAQLVPFRLYAYGHDLLSQDQLFDTGTNLVWSATFYGYDGHGSTRYLTDVSGAVTDTYDYDAFGNLIAQTGTTPNLYLYSGEQFDPDLNLYYLRARYHNPQTGRFWSQDTFEGFGQDPASLHKYTFNHNDPVNRIDPSGNTSLGEQQIVTGMAPTVRAMTQRMFMHWLGRGLNGAWAGIRTGTVVFRAAYFPVFYPKLTLALGIGGLGMAALNKEYAAMYVSMGGNPFSELRYLASEVAALRAASLASRQAGLLEDAALLQSQAVEAEAQLSLLSNSRVMKLTGDAAKGIGSAAELGIPRNLSPRQDLHLAPVDDGRSVLTANPSDLLKGLHDGAFTILRQPKPGHVVVDFGKPIGEYWLEGVKVGETQFGSIFFGKNGAHIVPANPTQW